MVHSALFVNGTRCSFGPAAAAQTKAGERHRCSHELEEAVATNRRPSNWQRHREIPVQARRETAACRSAHRGCANSVARRLQEGVDKMRFIDDNPDNLSAAERSSVLQASPRFAAVLSAPWCPSHRPHRSASRISRQIRKASRHQASNRGCRLFFRPQKVFRMPMTFQTPGHAVRLRVINHRHVIDLAVATRAANPAIHVR